MAAASRLSAGASRHYPEAALKGRLPPPLAAPPTDVKPLNYLQFDAPFAAWSILKYLSKTPFDNDYLVRLRQGDADTERHFVHHFSNAIRLSLRYRLRSWQLIDDIRQETFLRVLNFLRSDKSMDHPERLGAYVHSVSINVMMELLRASTRHPAMPEDAHQYVDGSVNPETEVVTRERKDLTSCRKRTGAFCARCF